MPSTENRRTVSIDNRWFLLDQEKINVLKNETSTVRSQTDGRPTLIINTNLYLSSTSDGTGSPSSVE